MSDTATTFAAFRARYIQVTPGLEDPDPLLVQVDEHIRRLEALSKEDAARIAAMNAILARLLPVGELVHAPAADGRTWQEVPDGR